MICEFRDCEVVVEVDLEVEVELISGVVLRMTVKSGDEICEVNRERITIQLQPSQNAATIQLQGYNLTATMTCIQKSFNLQHS